MLRVLLALAVLTSFASGMDRGETGYNFLRIPMGFDGTIFTFSQVARTGDLSQMFFNPALPLSEGALNVNGGSYVAGITFGSAVYALSEDMGVGAIFLNTGSMTETNVEGDSLGTFGGNYLALMVNKSRPLDDKLTVGGNLKFLYQGLAGETSMALALDIGAYYTLEPESFTFGACLRNVGYEIQAMVTERAPLPIELYLGGAYPVSEGTEVSLGLGKGLDTPFFFALGANWRLASFLEIAAGYNSKMKDLSSDGDLVLGFSAGAKLFVSGIELGYAFTPFGDLGDVHRIGVQYGF
jgi:hypothetical protein